MLGQGDKGDWSRYYGRGVAPAQPQGGGQARDLHGCEGRRNERTGVCGGGKGLAQGSHFPA